MKARIALLASGTRGDVQPLLALALHLRQHGHDVCFATHERFRPLLAVHGMPLVPLHGDPNALLHDPAALVYNGHPLVTARATLRYMRAAQPVYRALVQSAWDATARADVLVFSLPTFWGAALAHARHVPAIAAWLQPLGRTAAFPSPLQPWRGSLGRGYNRLSHALVERGMWQAWRGALRHWRHTSHLAPTANVREATEALYGFSPLVVPRPRDWPAHAHVTGYWFLDPPPDWQPPAALQRFVDAGPPPVYLGFGSLQHYADQAFMAAVCAALKRSGQRVLVAGTAPPDLPHSFAVQDVPHAWLFPRVAAAIHHGGAGTTAAALRAGVPQIIVPIGVDQAFWGQRVSALGVGVALPGRHVSAAGMDAALAAINAPDLRHRAATLGTHIRAEAGVARAVALLHKG